MLMRDLGVAIRVLAVFLGRFGVLLGLVVFILIVVVGRFAVMMRCRLVVRSGVLMVLVRRMLLFRCHGQVLHNDQIRDVSGHAAVW
jgi:hypothetical protein